MGRIQSIFNKLIPKKSVNSPKDLNDSPSTPQEDATNERPHDLGSDAQHSTPHINARFNDQPSTPASHEGWQLYIPPGTERYVTYETNDSISHADSILVNGDIKRRASAEFNLEAVRDVGVDQRGHPVAPQTDRVPLVPPPAELNLNADESELNDSMPRESSDKQREKRREGTADRRSQDDAKLIELAPIFHATREPDDRGSISLMLLPVSPPDLRSLAPIYLEEINELHQERSTPQRDEQLLDVYERYLSLVPNHMGVWRDFGDLLIELKGPEFASQVIREGLNIVTDPTPLLVILTEMSCRMCDYITAAHYIEKAVDLQHNNIEVLGLLRDIQRENKMFQSASDTDSLIQALKRSSELGDPLAGDPE